MTPSFATIHAECLVAGDRPAVFAHWMDPETRVRWEAPPESGMRYLNFADGPGQTEVIEISHEGAVIGTMDQVLTVIDAPTRVVSQITGTFGGAVTMVMQVVITFEETEGGTLIRGASQVMDLTGRDVQAEHEAGWAMIFEKFTADFTAHGPSS